MARAVAESPVPVICGVGHQIDVSISDLVAHTTCKTPTEAAGTFVGRVGEAAAHCRALERDLARSAERTLSAAERSVLDTGRTLGRRAETAVVRVGERLRSAAARLPGPSRRLLTDARKQERERRTRLLRGAFLPVRRAAEQMEAHGRLCDQLSPERTLARGFSLTRRVDGSLVRRVDDVAADAELRTQVSGGTIRSRVLGTEERK